MQKLGQIRAIIDDIKRLIDTMKSESVCVEDIRNIQIAADGINRVLYHSEKLKFLKYDPLENPKEYQDYVEEISALTELWEKSLQRRLSGRINAVFWEIYEYFDYVDQDIIYNDAVAHFEELPENLKTKFLSLRTQYPFLRYEINFMEKNYSLIRHNVSYMADHIETYRWIFEHLADERSRVILNGIIRYWFTFDLKHLNSLKYLKVIGADMLVEGWNLPAQDTAASKTTGKQIGVAASVCSTIEEFFEIPYNIGNQHEHPCFFYRIRRTNELWPYKCNVYTLWRYP